MLAMSLYSELSKISRDENYNNKLEKLYGICFEENDSIYVLMSRDQFRELVKEKVDFLYNILKSAYNTISDTFNIIGDSFSPILSIEKDMTTHVAFLLGSLIEPSAELSILLFNYKLSVWDTNEESIYFMKKPVESRSENDKNLERFFCTTLDSLIEEMKPEGYRIDSHIYS